MDMFRARTIDEMVLELNDTNLRLDMSNEEIRDLNIALNRGICSKDHAVISSLYTMIKLVQSTLEVNERLSNAKFQASQALAREGLFSPAQMYQVREDLESVSLLHSRHKKETERLIEEGQIAVRRNAALRLENEKLQDKITCLELGVTG